MPGPTDDSPVRTAPRPDCHACGAAGEPLYRGMGDRNWGVPGVWHLSRCPAPGCGLVWLDPSPVEEDIPLLYRDYYTHAFAPTRRSAWWDRVSGQILAVTRGYARDRPTRLARLMAGVGPVVEQAESRVLWQPAGAGGRLLDIGCGSGHLLAAMRSFGWDGRGVEPDPQAVQVATARGLNVTVGTVETADLPAGAFDLITMSHVIEHLPDPGRTLRRCRELLRPGGRLCVLTPNAVSLGAARFGRHWIAWDPPRHLMIFTPAALRAVAERAGFKVRRLITPARSAHAIWRASELIAENGLLPAGRCPFQPARVPAAAWFHLAEYRRSQRQPVGEELLLDAEVPA